CLFLSGCSVSERRPGGANYGTWRNPGHASAPSAAHDGHAAAHAGDESADCQDAGQRGSDESQRRQDKGPGSAAAGRPRCPDVADDGGPHAGHAADDVGTRRNDGSGNAPADAPSRPGRNATAAQQPATVAWQRFRNCNKKTPGSPLAIPASGASLIPGTAGAAVPTKLLPMRALQPFPAHGTQYWVLFRRQHFHHAVEIFQRLVFDHDAAFAVAVLDVDAHAQAAL